MHTVSWVADSLWGAMPLFRIFLQWFVGFVSAPKYWGDEGFRPVMGLGHQREFTGRICGGGMDFTPYSHGNAFLWRWVSSIPRPSCIYLAPDAPSGFGPVAQGLTIVLLSDIDWIGFCAST